MSRPTGAIQERHGNLVGVVPRLDAAAHTVVVKLADGTEHTFHVGKRTAVQGAQETAASAEKPTKAPVNYTEEAGPEAAHFFKKAI